jgi:ribosome biogenesis protein Tsr3
MINTKNLFSAFIGFYYFWQMAKNGHLYILEYTQCNTSRPTKNKNKQKTIYKMIKSKSKNNDILVESCVYMDAEGDMPLSF